MSKDAIERWHAITEIYLRCNITVPEDKLPALSGIAKPFQEATRDVYLAGIWNPGFSNLLHGD